MYIGSSSYAQYTKLLDFEGTTNGSLPFGSLISDDTFLYGMTRYGGTNDIGTIFKIKPDGSGYLKLLDCAGSTNGKSPRGSLIYDGTFLYGMTQEGGASNLGTVFKIKPDGSGYLKLLDFDGSNGNNPFGSLVFDGNFLYGMTFYGGINNSGVIFKIKPDGSGYNKLLDFDGSTNGKSPNGSLISDGTFLYGMTEAGGTNNMGTIFKIKTDGSGYVKLLDFEGSTNGSNPNGSLISDGTFLYGMTRIGGTNGFGTVFKIMTDGTGYMKLLDFAGTTNGAFPRDSLIFDGTYLNGMTLAGGANGLGAVFKIRPDGNDYLKLLDFAGNEGNYPWGSLIFEDNSFYGMTSEGGANNLGVVFKYGLTLGIDDFSTNNDGLSFCPNPSKDFITFQNITKKSTLEIFDVSGKKLIQLDVDSNSNSVNISSLSEGIYFLKIHNQFAGKLVKQ